MTPEGSDLLGTRAPPGFRSGFVAVLGLPNSGKSTLINCFLEREPLIVSFKPQTTRFQIRCVSTNESRQLVLVDTPGWHSKGQALGKYMRREIARSLEGADVLLYLIDAVKPEPERVRYSLGVLRKGAESPLVIGLNKIDRIGSGRLAELLDRLNGSLAPDEIVPLSALEKKNLLELDRTLTALLPEGPMLYPPEVEVDKPETFLVSELIREQLYYVTRQEVPFSCAVEVESLTRDAGTVKVAANIFVERDSQRGILIGAGGGKITEIRRRAAQRIGRYERRRAELELRVKVRPKWSADERFLDELGANR